jgi:hypothetical protein
LPIRTNAFRGNSRQLNQRGQPNVISFALERVEKNRQRLPMQFDLTDLRRGPDFFERQRGPKSYQKIRVGKIALQRLDPH